MRSTVRHAAAFLCLVMLLAGGADATWIGTRTAEARGQRASRKAAIQKQRQKNRQKAALRRARRKSRSKTRARARARQGQAESFLPRSEVRVEPTALGPAAREQVSSSTFAVELEMEMVRPEPAAATARATTSRSRARRSRSYSRRSALIPASHEKVAIERPVARGPRTAQHTLGAEPRPEPAPSPADKTVDRETAATRFIRRELKRSSKARWDISTPVFQYAGDATNPVTGTGPIEVIARQKRPPTGLWGRIGRVLSTQSERRFMVVIDAKGTPQVLSEQANSLPYRLMRKLGERIPIKEIATDALRSEGVRNGLGLGVGGLAIGATGGPMGWAAAGALIYRGAKLAIDGLDRRRAARETAMEKTVQDIKTDIENGETVTLAEAYRTYKVNLDHTKAGTTPLGLRRFTAELSPHGL